MSFFEELQDAKKQDPPREPSWRRALEWFAEKGPVVIFTIAVAGFIVFMLLLIFTDLITDDPPTTRGVVPEKPGFIEGPGSTYGFHILIDGRSIACVSNDNGLSCDWGAK